MKAQNYHVALTLWSWDWPQGHLLVEQLSIHVRLVTQAGKVEDRVCTRANHQIVLWLQ